MNLISPTPVIKDFQVAGQLNPQPDGSQTLTLDSSGNVLSVQPDGSWQTRGPGTAGPWEKGYVIGNLIIYIPDGTHAFAFPFVSV